MQRILGLFVSLWLFRLSLSPHFCLWFGFFSRYLFSYLAVIPSFFLPGGIVFFPFIGQAVSLRILIPLFPNFRENVLAASFLLSI